MSGNAELELPAWVEKRALPAETASGLREAVVHDLMATVQADCGMYHSVFFEDGKPHFHDVRVYGDRPRMVYLEACSGRPLTDYADVPASEMTPVNAFSESTLDDVGHLRIYETMWRQMRCVSVVCMTAVVEGTMAGWVGAHRVEGQPYFGADIVSRLGARIDAYVHCLDVARRLEGEASRVRGLLLFDHAGRLVSACDSGREWAKVDDLVALLRAEVASGAPREVFSAHGALVRVTPISGAGEACYCAELSPVEGWQVPEIMYLSVQKRRVAELAAFGATVAEIARHLDISPWTVKAHLKDIYGRLGVASRVELAEHLRPFQAPPGV